MPDARKMIQFLGASGSALEAVRDEVRRTRTWIQQDQMMRWQGELKRLSRELEQAEAELFTSRLSAMTSHSAARQMAVTRLRRKQREVEAKLARVRKWGQNYDSLVEPLVKKLEGLQHFLTHEMPKAVSSLSQAQSALESYRQVAPEGGSAEGGGTKESAGEEGESP